MTSNQHRDISPPHPNPSTLNIKATSACFKLTFPTWLPFRSRPSSNGVLLPSFSRTRGRNIRFSNQQCVATRTDTEFCHGYAFTSQPLLLGERLVVQILATEPMYVGALALGLTSCDPARLTAEDLPDDSDLLLDRPEYWVVSKDVASSPQPGDEIAFTVTHFGEVQMSKNGGPPNVVMHVDQSLQLWAFFDVYGSTQRVRMLAERPTSPPRQRQSNPSPATILQQQQQQQQQQQHCNHSNAATELSRFSEMVQFKPAIGGGTVLVVNLPPQTGYVTPSSSTPQPTYASAGHRSQHVHPPAVTASSSTASTASTSHPGSSRQSSPPLTGTMASTGSSTYVEPVNYQSLDGTLTSQASSHLQQWSEGLQPTPGQPNECSVCYERSIDSVLYMCGHMCMCYPCAIQQWCGKGGGHCPLCRATIRDVIRIYRSWTTAQPLRGKNGSRGWCPTKSRWFVFSRNKQPPPLSYSSSHTIFWSSRLWGNYIYAQDK